MTIASRARRIFIEYDVAPVEVFIALQAVAWGFALVSPHQTFSSTTAYYLLSLLAQEEVWGVLVALVGIIHIGNILMSPPNHILRMVTIIMIGIFWSGVVIAIWISQGMVFPGAWLFSVNALASYWVQWRLGGYRA